MFCAGTTAPLAIDAVPSAIASATLTARGTLMICGTDGNDKIGVRKSNGQIIVGLNGHIDHFDAKTVRRFRVSLGAGDDIFAAHGSIRHRMTVDGEAGNDNIITGFGDDQLNGGDGDDALVGNYGADRLSGGNGRDLFVSDPVPQVDPGFAGLSALPGRSRNLILARGDDSVDTIRSIASDDVHADDADVRESLEPVITLDLPTDRTDP
jgi:hypothetical protein